MFIFKNISFAIFNLKDVYSQLLSFLYKLATQNGTKSCSCTRAIKVNQLTSTLNMFKINSATIQLKFYKKKKKKKNNPPEKEKLIVFIYKQPKCTTKIKKNFKLPSYAKRSIIYRADYTFTYVSMCATRGVLLYSHVYKKTRVGTCSKYRDGFSSRVTSKVSPFTSVCLELDMTV